MIKSEDLRLGQPRVLETDNNLILPVHKWIRLLVTGVNVIHSFGLHSLGLRFDGIPGRFNSVSFQFARLGFFRGACMEFCGILHAYMPIKILGVAECIYYQDSQLLILPYLGAPILVAIKLNWFIAPLFGQIYKHYSFLLALSHFAKLII